MADVKKLTEEIVKRLRPLKPEKVILFGSYAWGNPDEGSDLDLYVVTQDDFMPRNFKEKMEVKLKVSAAVKDLQKIIPIDIITHTKKMHEKFLEMNSLFSQEILKKGISLL
jgi:predicted nucleotidyltransferase